MTGTILLRFHIHHELNDKYDAFRTELLANSNIKNVGWSTRIPTGRLLDNMGASMMSGDTLAPINADIKFVSADQDFISTYDIKMVAGRNFSRDFSTDTSSFLINEAAVKVLGFKKNEDAIGKDFGYGDRNGKLIGVFHDFHFESYAPEDSSDGIIYAKKCKELWQDIH